MHYIYPPASGNCHAQPCLTLGDYLSNASHYFTSDTSFVFLPGEHSLEDTLALYDMVNVTLRGADRRARITVSSGVILFKNLSSVSVSSLKIVFHGRKYYLSYPGFLFSNCHSFEIADTEFTGVTTEAEPSRALSFYNCTGYITNCYFSQGHSERGGAIEIISSTVSFSNIDVFNNSAALSGGAIYSNQSTLIFSNNNTFTKNVISGFLFDPPKSEYNRGGAIFASQTNVTLKGINTMAENLGALVLVSSSVLTIEGTAMFSSNRNQKKSIRVLSGNEIPLRDTYGGAISLMYSNFYCGGNVSFVSNSAGSGGAVYSQMSHAVYQGNTSFLNNSADSTGGGMRADGGTVQVSGEVSFVQNCAENGGAMALVESAWIILQKQVSIIFSSNTAAKFGGGLFIEESGVVVCQNFSHECFFDLESIFVSVPLIFTNNSALAGSALFGGALEHCKPIVNGSVQNNSTGHQMLQDISIITPSKDLRSKISVISSPPQKLCFCNNNGVPNCSEETTVDIIRGKTFNLSIVALGQLDSPVPIDELSTNLLVADDGLTDFKVMDRYLVKKGVCSATISFNLLTSNDHAVVVLSHSECNIIRLNIYLNVFCPNGFDLVENRCDCSKVLADAISTVKCDVNAGINYTGDYWVYPIFNKNQTYQGFMWRSLCPNGYCKKGNESDPVVVDFSFPDNVSQCIENRAGILCGACKKGYSLTLNSLKCKRCDDKFLSVMLFFGVAGVALIALLLVLNMTVAAGTLNGLILYANILNVHRELFFPPGKPGFNSVNPLTVFISWLNLDFGIPICFYDGLDAYQYSWLQYVFPLYLWLLMGAIIIASKYSRRVGKLLGSNPVAVLATVILMSYTKLIQTTVEALNSSYIEYSMGYTKRVWTYDGNVFYFEGKHILTSILAISVLVFFLSPYVFLLTFGYRLQAFSSRRGFRWFNKLKPLLDAYYAPYNKETRYWTGLMLIVRFGLFLSFILVRNNLIAIFSVYAVIGLLPWIMQNKPVYERRLLNILEASFILNVLLLCVATAHVSMLGGIQAVASYLSVGIALAEFIGILALHLLLRVKNVPFLRKFILAKQQRRAQRVEMRAKSLEKGKEEGKVISSTLINVREPLLDIESS